MLPELTQCKKIWVVVQKVADQVSHDNGVIHEWVSAHAQGKLKSTRRLTS